MRVVVCEEVGELMVGRNVAVVSWKREEREEKKETRRVASWLRFVRRWSGWTSGRLRAPQRAANVLHFPPFFFFFFILFRFVNKASSFLRQALKEPLRAKYAVRDTVAMRVQKWEGGVGGAKGK